MCIRRKPRQTIRGDHLYAISLHFRDPGASRIRLHLCENKAVKLLVEFDALFFVVEEHGGVTVADAVHWLQGAVCRDTKHREETVLLVGVDQLVDRDLSLFHLDAKFRLDFVAHVEDGLAGDSVQDAAVVRWGQ